MYYVFAKIEDEYIFQLWEFEDEHEENIDIDCILTNNSSRTLETWYDEHGDFLSLKGKRFPELYDEVTNRDSARMVRRQYGWRQ